jgi:hypothetical protein
MHHIIHSSCNSTPFCFKICCDIIQIADYLSVIEDLENTSYLRGIFEVDPLLGLTHCWLSHSNDLLADTSDNVWIQVTRYKAYFSYTHAAAISDTSNQVTGTHRQIHLRRWGPMSYISKHGLISGTSNTITLHSRANDSLADPGDNMQTHVTHYKVYRSHT